MGIYSCTVTAAIEYASCPMKTSEGKPLISNHDTCTLNDEQVLKSRQISDRPIVSIVAFLNNTFFKNKTVLKQNLVSHLSVKLNQIKCCTYSEHKKIHFQQDKVAAEGTIKLCSKMKYFWSI